MDILVIKLACLAVLVAVFVATVWLTPRFFGTTKSAKRTEDREASAERALPRG